MICPNNSGVYSSSSLLSLVPICTVFTYVFRHASADVSYRRDFFSGIACRFCHMLDISREGDALHSTRKAPTPVINFIVIFVKLSINLTLTLTLAVGGPELIKSVV